MRINMPPWKYYSNSLNDFWKTAPNDANRLIDLLYFVKYFEFEFPLKYYRMLLKSFLFVSWTTNLNLNKQEDYIRLLSNLLL